MLFISTVRCAFNAFEEFDEIFQIYQTEVEKVSVVLK